MHAGQVDVQPGSSRADPRIDADSPCYLHLNLRADLGFDIGSIRGSHVGSPVISKAVRQFSIRNWSCSKHDAVSPLRSTLLFAFLILACKGHSDTSNPDNRAPQPSALGMRANAPNVRWIKGEQLGRLARAYGHKGTLFNIWATWCGSCKGEIPKLRQISQAYATRGIQVVLVSVDEPEQFNQLDEWIKVRGFSPPAWAAARPLGEFKKALAKNWLGNIPVTFLYDSQGQRRYFWNGPVETPEVTPILDGLLDGKAIDGERQYALSAGVTDTDSMPTSPPDSAKP
jgi:thiol-disulfide isomerase/thioredoxin